MTALLEIDRLNVHFGNAHVVCDVSLSLAGGGALAASGESGSGKSTLARILIGLDRPSSGTFRLMVVTPHSGPAATGRRRGGRCSLSFRAAIPR